METAQLIKATISTLYLKDSVVVSENLTDKEKLQHSIFGETKTMRTEEIIERWNLKNKKDSEKMFWNFMEENKINDTENYFIVFTDY